MVIIVLCILGMALVGVGYALGNISGFCEGMDAAEKIFRR